MEHWIFSNFQPARVTDALGIEYPTVEHYFQAQKTSDRAAREQIAASDTPDRAKHLGRSLALRPDWEQVKDAVMAEGLRQRFAPGTEDARRLLAADPADLVEETTWHDQIWGICVCPRHGGTGENRLGRLLRERRAALLAQGGRG